MATWGTGTVEKRTWTGPGTWIWKGTEHGYWDREGPWATRGADVGIWTENGAQGTWRQGSVTEGRGTRLEIGETRTLGYSAWGHWVGVNVGTAIWRGEEERRAWRGGKCVGEFRGASLAHTTFPLLPRHTPFTKPCSFPFGPACLPGIRSPLARIRLPHLPPPTSRLVLSEAPRG